MGDHGEYVGVLCRGLCPQRLRDSMGGLPQLQWVWRSTGTYRGGPTQAPCPPFPGWSPAGMQLEERRWGGPSRPPPLPLTWHLLWADGNSVSEEAERGPCSRLGRGGDTQLSPPSACAEGLSCPGPQHCWDELGRSQPIPGGGSQQRKGTTLPPPFVPQLCCLTHFTSCLNPAWLHNPRTPLEGRGGQAGAPHPQIPALTPSLPQFPHSGSEKRLLPRSGAGKPRSRTGKIRSSPEPPPASKSQGDARIPFRESRVTGVRGPDERGGRGGDAHALFIPEEVSAGLFVERTK